MRDHPFRRPSHRKVADVLSRLDGPFLKGAGCYFGGGTRIVLELGEYRESRDIDFLCASREGYRQLRETISESSLGEIAPDTVRLAREVRGDQYGIRTWIDCGELKLKFEILREARIDLAAMKVPRIGVACLDHAHAFAEKLLANADRGLDASTLSRDAVDLAFMMSSWPVAPAVRGLEIARAAYGADVDRKLVSAVTRLREDRPWRARCIEGLGIEDTKTLAAGLTALSKDGWKGKAVPS
jgi:Nucleotidyl transferase AbiEii toxin, Type IV TA system